MKKNDESWKDVMKERKNIAVIFAGGSGMRMGAGIPKQFLKIDGMPILVHTLQWFQFHKEIDEIYLAISEEYISYTWEIVKEYRMTKVVAIVIGGETAQDSIYNALKKAEERVANESIALIHDGVRPVISHDVITNNILGVKNKGNAITCTHCYETILLSKDGEKIEYVPYRKDTYAAQAPQSFYLADIIKAHDEVRSSPTRYENMVDACTIIRSQGKEAYMVMGNRGNIKVTTPEDVYLFKALLQYKEGEQAFGMGQMNPIEMRINNTNV